MFQEEKAPEDLPRMTVAFADVAAPNAAISDGSVQVKLDKLLARTGLATSVTDGLRKLKQNAVKIDGELKTEIVAAVRMNTDFTLRAGKRMVKVTITT
jgi:tyrosyl-tRNA synthetase